MREKIIKILRKMACDVTGKSLTAIGEEESIEVADAILEVVVAEIPEKREIIQGVEGIFSNRENSGFNVCREIMIKKIGRKE